MGSGRAYFNLDWITLLVMAIVAAAGVIVFFAAHRGREIDAHLTDTRVPAQAVPGSTTAPDTQAPDTQAPDTQAADPRGLGGPLRRCWQGARPHLGPW